MFLGVDKYVYKAQFTATASEMSVDIKVTGHCFIEVVDTSAMYSGTVFLLTWNANANRILSEESSTKNTNPRRPSNGNNNITLSSLTVGHDYKIYVTGLGT